MINKGVRLTTGLLVAALLVTAVPVDVFEAAPVESTGYITGTTYSFSAGAHSAISETVVLESIGEDDYLADVEVNDAPTVTTPEVTPETEVVNPYANIAIASKINEYLNIRAEANKDSAALGKLYKNGAATVLEVLDGWYKIKSGSVTGYISADYVVVGDEATCKAASTRVGKVTAASLRLRKKASTDAEVQTLISKGNKVTVLDESIDGWYKVKYKSYTGYVSADYVKVTTEYTYAESKEEEKARLKAEEEARKAAEKKNNKNNKTEKDYKKPTSKNGQAVVNYAVQFVGNPYKWGGTSLTKGADCSGFVMKVYEAFGIKLPHSSYDLRKVGKKVKASEMLPGDIICYSGHVAIYMGNGKIVHASNKKDGIKISSNYKYKKVLAIRRVID